MKPAVQPGIYMCASCESAMEFYEHSSQKCVLCDQRLKGCDQCYLDSNSEVVCSRCHHGFFLEEDKGTCYDCLDHDNKCDSCTTEKCLGCRKGWTLWFDSDYCVPDIF